MRTADQYLLDANIIIALFDSEDFHHKRAQAVYEKISQDGGLVFLSDIAINEFLSVLAKRMESKKKTERFGDVVKKFREAISDTPILSLYELVSKNYKNIMDVMIKYQARLNFHDALTVLFLREVPEVVLVSFDADFTAVAGLELLSN